MLFHFLTGNLRALCFGLMCAWDGPASDMGLAAPASTEAPAAAAGGGAGADGHDAKATDEGHDADDADESPESADAEADAEDDVDQDPLDLLTEREEGTGDERPIEERYKHLSKRARKLEREAKKSLQLRMALREAGVDLKTLLDSHRQLAGLHQSANQNPRLRALLYGEADDASDQPRDRAGSRSREEAPVKYPFDTEDPVGGFMKGFHEQTQRDSREVLSRLENIEKTLGSRVERIERGTTQAQYTAVRNDYKTAADAAAKELDANLRPLFRDAMISAAENFIAGRHRMTPQQVVDHYLGKMRLTAKQKNRASDATKQVTAQRNQSQQRRPGAGAGTPASPASKRVPRLEEFNRNLSRSMGAAGG